MTQGLVSILIDGKMAFKCVCGSNGMMAGKLAGRISRRNYKNFTVFNLHDLCLKVGFGVQEDLVVQSKNETYPAITPENNSSNLYKKHFNEPEFNPRWKKGLADYIRVVRFESANPSRATVEVRDSDWS